MRVDKWIWAVRLVKTRTLATEMCRLGRVTINETPAKPSRALAINDLVEVRFSRGLKKIYRVLGYSEKRIGAAAAAELYEDLSPAPPPGQFTKTATRERGTGRPTKKDRRQIDKLKQ